MGIISAVKTTMLAFALANGAGGNGLENKIKRELTFVNDSEEQPRYITINGATYRQRPPRASCDPTLYGTPVREEPKKPIPKGPIYFGLMALATIIAANIARKKHDAIIAKYAPKRDFDFFNERRQPTVDYVIEREGDSDIDYLL